MHGDTAVGTYVLKYRYGQQILRHLFMYAEITSIQKICNVGLVVEYIPATDETRVRFPDVALVFLVVLR